MGEAAQHASGDAEQKQTAGRSPGDRSRVWVVEDFCGNHALRRGARARLHLGRTIARNTSHRQPLRQPGRSAKSISMHRMHRSQRIQLPSTAENRERPEPDALNQSRASLPRRAPAELPFSLFRDTLLYSHTPAKTCLRQPHHALAQRPEHGHRLGHGHWLGQRQPRATGRRHSMLASGARGAWMPQAVPDATRQAIAASGNPPSFAALADWLAGQPGPWRPR